MGEPAQIFFSFSEIAEALVKKQGLHDGHWGILIKFNIAGINAPGPKGNLVPTALIPVTEMGIQRFDEPNGLTINAAEVNPEPKIANKKKPTKASKKATKKVGKKG